MELTEVPSKQQLNKLLEYYQTGQYGDAEKLAVSITQEFPSHNFSWKNSKEGNEQS